MKRKLFGVLFTLLPGILVAQNLSNQRNLVQLGVSEINITPAEPVIMSGYDARQTPSKGVHDSLFASALFLSGEQQALLISADIIGFGFAFVDTVKKMISLKTHLREDNIMIIATHTHSAPAIHTYEAELPQENERYIQTLKEKLVMVAMQAMTNLRPFSMGMGKSKCDLNINRRAVFSDGGVWLGRDLDGICDHELDVIKFVGKKNDLVAVFVNWPCHGTAMGQENYMISGDWPASAARYIKQHAGKNVVVIVTAGASANINPIYGPGNEFDEMEAVGYHAGKEAWTAMNEIKTSPVKSIKFLNSGMTYPGKKRWTDQFPQKSIPTGTNEDIRLSAVKLNNVVLFGISGELMTEMGLQVKKNSPYPHTVLITHCNGLSGYICTDKAFVEGGYEPKVSRLMPGVEKALVKKCLEVIHSF